MTFINQIILSSFILSFTVFSQNIDLADKYFKQKDFNNAQIEYLRAANMGNVRAYYRLADIYLHGLGRNKDEVTAMLWLSLAAEHDYRESKKILTRLYSKLNKTQLTIIEKVTATFIAKRGKHHVSSQYEPEILNENITSKINMVLYD